MSKEKLHINDLIHLAKEFCIKETQYKNKELYGVTDGKAVGTFIEQKFKAFLQEKYEIVISSTNTFKSTRNRVFNYFKCLTIAVAIR